MIVLDTSVLIESLTGEKPLFAALRQAIVAGRVLFVPSLVLYEWRRGPRTADEISGQEKLLPPAYYVPFDVDEAIMSARLYRSLSRPRTREMDIGIAACAIVRDAELWTLNPADFDDIPGLRLYRA